MQRMKSIGIFLIATFLILISDNLMALTILKGTLSGVVRDGKTGNTIEGVSVYITDEKTGAITNSKGEYHISNINEGKHLIEVTHLGFTTIAEFVEVVGDTKKDFSLTISIIENNAVVVFGTSKASQLNKIPFQVAVTKKADLLQSSSTNIIESITKQAGVSSLSSGPAVSKPVIRGLGFNRVLTINDGVRQEGQQWGEEHGIEIDAASVNKIEILKGPASIIYGSDAMAGVINIISNVPVPNNTVAFNAGSDLQSNNKLRSLYGNFSGNKNGLSFNVYGTVKAAADYKNKYDGYVYNSNFNEHNFGGYVGYNNDWGYSHLLLSKFNLVTGLVEGERDSLGNFIKVNENGDEAIATEEDFNRTSPETPYQKIRHFKIASDNSIKIGSNRLKLNLGFQRNEREEMAIIDNVEKSALYFDLKTITYTSQFYFKEINGWKNSIGLNGMSQTNTNLGVEQIIPDYKLFDIGSYFFTQKEFNKINLSAGFRYDTRNVNVETLKEGNQEKGEAFTKAFSNFSGSAGFTYPFAKNFNLKLNIARAFRAPSIPELATNGAHEGTTRYEYGDVNLKSEVSTQTDASVEYANDHFSVNVAGYLNHFNNFIYYRKLENASGLDSLVETNGQLLTAFKFDQQKSNLSGIEVSLDVHPHPLDWLHIENTFSIVRGKFLTAVEGSYNIPFMPAPKLFTEFRADFKKIKNNIRNFYLKLEIENTFQQNNIFTAYNTETSTPGYTLVNAGIGTEMFSRKNKQLFGIYFTGSNLADVSYQNHLSRLKYLSENLATGRMGVFNMGRNFGVKINVPLSFSISK